MPRKTPIYGFNLFYHDESVISAEDVRPGSAYTGTLQPDPTNTLNYNFKLMEDLVQSILNGRLAFTSISTVQDVVAGRDVVVGRQLVLNPEYGLSLNADHRPSPHVLLDFSDALVHAGDADNVTLTVTRNGTAITDGTQKNPFKPDNSTLSLSGSSVYPVVFLVSSSGTLIDSSLSGTVRLYLSFDTVPQGLSGVRLETSQDGSSFTTIGYYTQNLGNKYLFLGPVTLPTTVKAVRITLEGTNSTTTNFKVRRVALLHAGTPPLEGFYLSKAGGRVFGGVSVKGNVDASGIIASSYVQTPVVQGTNTGRLLINARAYGAEVRIDEDNSGGDQFSITAGPSGGTVLMEVQASGNVGIGTASPAEKLDVNGKVRATQIISTATTGTAPFVVSSTTAVSNLNADLIDGLHASQFLRSDTSTTFNGTTLTVNGDIAMAAGKTVDGVDISVFKSAYDTHEHNGSDAPKVKAENVLAKPYGGTSYTTDVKSYLDNLQNQINNLVQGTTTADNILVRNLTVTQTFSASGVTLNAGALSLTGAAGIGDTLTITTANPHIQLKESSSDGTPGVIRKISGTLLLSSGGTNPIQIHRGTVNSAGADLEIFKDAGSSTLPIYLRFHQSTRHWEAIKATNGLISFVNGDDTGYVDIQAKRVTANQDLVVSGRTIADSSGILYAPLPAIGNRDRDILVERVAVWGDGMYPFALDLYKSDGWFTIPRTLYYGSFGQRFNHSTGPRSGTTRVTRIYIVGVNNARGVYDPNNQYWNNGRTTGIPWVRVRRTNDGATWEGSLVFTWGVSPNIVTYVIEVPNSIVNFYFEIALGIWWDASSPSWPTANIAGDNVANNYQNYGVDIQWTVYQVWFEVYDRY